ncbi:Purine nucleoside permease [Lachnellula willkommii]|uniref:Purine nucleoside permease n=1 Tax=Lachnellula willkommii TaxID=215461 RepID=A0A559MHW5_9HELO|nr:Purine nucleoside permease [Lachnellula willkommii]
MAIKYPVVRALAYLQLIATCLSSAISQLSETSQSHGPMNPRHATPGCSPKVFIINAFSLEAESFYGVPELDLLAVNYTIAGLSPLYPEAHCSADGQVCQVTTGESEINAASTISALIYSRVFNLKNTYFLIAGIAGVNPAQATTGSVTFARFEFDVRDIGLNFSTGYIAYGTKKPLQYPQHIYGTEVFEVNDNLRHKAMQLASQASLNDTKAAVAFRKQYDASTPGSQPPALVACDGVTSDNYYSGPTIASAYDAYTTLITNGSAVYCATAQEDSAILGVLLRGAKAGLVDFSRIIVMRTAANFDRAPAGANEYQFFFYQSSGGFASSVANLHIAGVPIIQGIVDGWATEFEQGIAASNYIGDIFGTLGGTPDFGPYPYFGQG